MVVDIGRLLNNEFRDPLLLEFYWRPNDTSIHILVKELHCLAQQIICCNVICSNVCRNLVQIFNSSFNSDCLHRIKCFSKCVQISYTVSVNIYKNLISRIRDSRNVHDSISYLCILESTNIRFYRMCICVLKKTEYFLLQQINGLIKNFYKAICSCKKLQTLLVSRFRSLLQCYKWCIHPYCSLCHPHLLFKHHWLEM